MLVFISDLHLTDGSTNETISPDAFTLFVEDLNWMVAQACRRRGPDKRSYFEPIDCVDLILLGDIFDVLRTHAWQRDDGLGQVRPWTPEMAAPRQRADAHARLATRVTEITRATIERNGGWIDGGPAPKPGRGLEALRELAVHGIALDPNAIPADQAIDPNHRIPVRIWYMPGNHDWFYNVGLPDYDPARQLLVDALGLTHPADQPFPHTLDEAPPALRELFRAHKVFAQHGDLYDPENIQVDLDVANPGPGLGRRAHSSIGDMIVIELLNGLPAQIETQLRAIGDPLADDRDFLRSLEELDNVRPMLAVPQWIAGVLQRKETGAPEHRARERARRDAVSKAIRVRLKTLTEDPFARRLDKFLRWDLVDTLEAGALLSDWLSIDALAKISRWGEKRSRPLSYRDHAIDRLKEIQGGVHTPEAEFIVFGHTHHPEVVALDLDGPRAWVYINTGTWRRVHERCVAESDRLEFISFHVMSFAAVYKGTERSGRPYETWTGTLGSRPPG
jgi:UDP-2,3-diacylglucosamine pyrophosphatase LpxH